MILGEINNKSVRKTITEYIAKQKLGLKNYLLEDEEAYMLATTEIEVAHGLLRDTNTISDELQQVLSDMGRQDVNNSIKTRSKLWYARRVIDCLNKEEEDAEGQMRKTMTGTIKVSGLSHKRGKQSDTRLAWEIFHNIYNMYSDIKKKDGTNADLLLTSMSDHKYMNNVSETTVNTHDNRHNKFTFQERMIIPPDLHQIQARATQVWNCD